MKLDYQILLVNTPIGFNPMNMMELFITMGGELAGINMKAEVAKEVRSTLHVQIQSTESLIQFNLGL